MSGLLFIGPAVRICMYPYLFGTNKLITVILI